MNSARSSKPFVAGRIPVLECLRARKRRARKLFFLPSSSGLDEIFEAAGNIPQEARDRYALDQMTYGVPHQGVVLDADPIPMVPLDLWLKRQEARPHSCALLLDGIEDPHNFGAVIRSAAAFGASGVLFGKDRSAPLSTAAMKAAAGAAEYMDLIQITNLSRGLGQLKEAGFWVSGLDAQGDRLLWEADLRGKSLIVVGSEGDGMHRLVRESCDFLVRIPIEGAISSLNASVSAAIALSEWKRQSSTAV